MAGVEDGGILLSPLADVNIVRSVIIGVLIDDGLQRHPWHAISSGDAFIVVSQIEAFVDAQQAGEVLLFIAAIGGLVVVRIVLVEGKLVRRSRPKPAGSL